MNPQIDRTLALVIIWLVSLPSFATPQTVSSFTDADYAKHISQLKKQLPDGFSVFIWPPSVVLGDGPSSDVKSICRGTVRWAVEHLRHDYFRRDPDEIITIWLFNDDASYRQYTKSIFNDEPTTPYGYYSA